MIKLVKKDTIQFLNEITRETGYKPDIVLELWGASTKHPDSVFKFSNWEGKTDLIKEEYQIYQWLLYCASCLTFPFYAKELVEFAAQYYKWE